METCNVNQLNAEKREHSLKRSQIVREASLFTWLLITEEPFEFRASASFTLRAGALEPSTVLTLT